MDALYKRMCPVCGGDIWASDLLRGLPCKECQKKDWKNLPPFSERKHLRKRVRKFLEFFQEKTGHRPWKLQEVWALRLLKGQSFCLAAPTGVGKTTFGVVAALYFKPSITVFPSTLLLRQMAERFGLTYYHSGCGWEKEVLLEAETVAVTTNFLYRHPEFFSGRKFSLVFFDDVDAVVRRPRAVEILLNLAGYSPAEIESAWKDLREGRRPGRKTSARVLVSSATLRPRTSRTRLLTHLLGLGFSSPGFGIRNIADRWFSEDWVDLVKRIGRGVLVFVPGDQGRRGVEEAVRRLRVKGVEVVPYSEASPRDFQAFATGKVQVLVGIASAKNPLARGIDLPEARACVFTGIPKIRIPLEGEISEAKRRLLQRILRGKPERWQELARRRGALLTEDSLILPDAVGYLQASGRVSRMYAGGVSFGLSLVLNEDPWLLKQLERKASWRAEVEFRPLEDLEGLLQKVDQDRRKKKQRMGGTVNLVIVESPRKAKTLSGFLGNPARREVRGLSVYEGSRAGEQFLFVATRGHLFDLVTKEGTHGVLLPEFVPIFGTLKRKEGKQWVDELEEEGEDARRVVEVLEDLTDEVDRVFLATDPDQEGERIAFDLWAHLRPFTEDLHRLELHAITPREFWKALELPRKVELRLVEAQFLRRIADRLVGFVLSGYLQRRFSSPNYSAGRVQTPVLRWIVERYKLSQKKRRVLVVEIGGRRITLDWEWEKPDPEIRIEKLREEVRDRELRPPLTTDGLISEGGRLGLSAVETMKAAQELFETGLITYHRTDSTRVAPEGIRLAKDLLENLGHPEEFVGRTWGEGGAHECIRPTKRIFPEEISELYPRMGNRPRRLYARIFWRFLESQAVKGKVRWGHYRLEIGGREFEREFLLEVLSPSFMERKLPEIPEGKVKARVRIKRVSERAPFTQAEVVQEMKKRGIGRPSTYAKVVETLIRRGYVMNVRGYLIPTKKAEEVLGALEPFGRLTSEEFTRELEEEMDQVGEDKASAKEVLEKLWEEIRPFANRSGKCITSH